MLFIEVERSRAGAESCWTVAPSSPGGIDEDMAGGSAGGAEGGDEGAVDVCVCV